MEKNTYDFLNHESWNIWNKPLDSKCYIFTYRHPIDSRDSMKIYGRQHYGFGSSDNNSESINEHETFRGCFFVNSVDNEFYICIKNENILDTDIYTVNSLAEVMEFICDTNNPKNLNGTIHIHETNTDIVKAFGSVSGLALSVMPTFCISQENLNIIHCVDFGRYWNSSYGNSNIDILRGIKRYCEKFLIEKLLSYKNFN